MPIKAGDTIKHKNDYEYLISSEHRPGGNHIKSKWVVTPEEEFNCFTKCVDNNWCDSEKGWGMIQENGKGNFTLLGHGSKMEELYLAKFIGVNPWHGYPANIRANIHDRPNNEILMNWYANNLIHKHQISRIKNGKI